jgi:hypothetical protein
LSAVRQEATRTVLPGLAICVVFGNYMGIATALCATLGSFVIAASMGLSFVPLKVEALYGIELLRPLWFFLPGGAFFFWIGVCALLAAWALRHLERLEL